MDPRLGSLAAAAGRRLQARWVRRYAVPALLVLAGWRLWPGRVSPPGVPAYVPAIATGVAADHAGGLYVADYGGAVWHISRWGVITHVAGGGSGKDGGPAANAGLEHPLGLAVGPDGSLYIAENEACRIRKVDRRGIITTVAGSGRRGFGGDGGPATSAELDGPIGVTLDRAGSLYLSDTANHRVRKVDRQGVISTVAGTGEQGFAGDGGPAVTAMLDTPIGIAVDPQGSLYIVDNGNCRVRKVDPAGRITTVAGAGVENQPGKQRGWQPADPASIVSDPKPPRHPGDGGPALDAHLSYPVGISLAGDGGFLLGDTGSGRVRRVGPDGKMRAAGQFEDMQAIAARLQAGKRQPTLQEIERLGIPLDVAVVGDTVYFSRLTFIFGGVWRVDRAGRVRAVTSPFPRLGWEP